MIFICLSFIFNVNDTVKLMCRWEATHSLTHSPIDWLIDRSIDRDRSVHPSIDQPINQSIDQSTDCLTDYVVCMLSGVYSNMSDGMSGVNSLCDEIDLSQFCQHVCMWSLLLCVLPMLQSSQSLCDVQ